MYKRYIRNLIEQSGYVFPTDVSIKNLSLLANLGSKPIILCQQKIMQPYDYWQLAVFNNQVSERLIKQYVLCPLNEKDINQFFKLFNEGCKTIRTSDTSAYNLLVIINWIFTHSYGKFENE